MNHTMYETCIANRPYNVCPLKCRWTKRYVTLILPIEQTRNDPKIVDKVSDSWHSRLPIDYTRYDPNIADRSYDVCPLKSQWPTRCITLILRINHARNDPKIVEKVPELWPNRLPIDYTNYGPNIDNRSYNMCPLKSRWPRRCMIPILPIDHARNDPKIVDKVPELWPYRLPIDYTRYDPNIVVRSYDVLPDECR